MKSKIINGNCLEELKKLDANSVDAVITDPPYGIGFMNKEWDSPDKHKELIEREAKRSEKRFKEGKSPTTATYSKGVQPGLPIGGAKENRWFQEWCEEWGKECLRVLKPGGYLLSFAAPRMYHRMTTGLEDAGFEIRDQIMWIFGSGFPKSLDVSKQIDKKKKATRVTEPATEEAKQYDGWGTALKPAHEPIVVARKPIEGTVAENVLQYGVGGINVDGCRIGTSDSFGDGKKATKIFDGDGGYNGEGWEAGNELGRWPANIMFDKEAAKALDEQSGERKGFASQNCNNQKLYGGNALNASSTTRNGFKQGYNDIGGASRFFYVAKTNKKDRNEGGATNNHPTVKPTELMRYLVRMVTPKNGIVLDPFMGSGSTGKAAILEGMRFIGIEKEKEYCKIAKQRVKYEENKNKFWE